MKVLMTADAVGGVWTYAIELAHALQPFGVEVVLATMGSAPTDEQRREARARGNVLVEESRFKLEWMEDPWRDVDRAGDWLLELEAIHQPDVVHLNGYAHGALSWRAPVLVVGHSCVRSWLSAVKGGEIGSEWDEYTRRVRDGLGAADLVVAPSRTMLGHLEEHYGPLDATSVIFNARDARRFTPGPKRDMILSAGRLWDEAKNVGTLARVAGSLAWPVVIAGSTESPDGATIDLSKSVSVLGQVTPMELSIWMSRASLYVLPARYEPFGLSVLEAALSGCALVLGDIPSLREIWGDTAVYVSPTDEVSLVRTIRGLCRDRDLLATLGRRARGRALAFSPARMADEYAAAYKRLVTANPVPEATACVS